MTGRWRRSRTLGCTPAERADDLVGRLSLAEKVGLMFHNIIEVGPRGHADGGRRRGRPGLHPPGGRRQADQPRQRARPAVGRASPPAGPTRCRSSRPPPRTPSRSRSAPTRGTASPPTSAPPSPPAPCRSGRSRSGSAALRDPERIREFADIARQEYVRGRDPLLPAPADRPRHRAALGTAVPHLRQRRRLRRRGRGGVHRRLPAPPRARAGLRGHHGQALPRRRSAARR